MSRIALILFLVCGMVGVTMPVFAEEAAKPAPVAPVEAPEEETDIIAGKVTSVDTANSTLTVLDEAGKSYTLTATKEETSIWKGDNTVELSDVKVDDPIELEYYKDKDSKLVAIWIDVLTKDTGLPTEVKPETAVPPTGQ